MIDDRALLLKNMLRKFFLAFSQKQEFFRNRQPLNQNQTQLQATPTVAKDTTQLTTTATGASNERVSLNSGFIGDRGLFEFD